MVCCKENKLYLLIYERLKVSAKKLYIYVSQCLSSTDDIYLWSIHKPQYHKSINVNFIILHFQESPRGLDDMGAV